MGYNKYEYFVLGMCCALPIFAVNPVIPLVGAILVLTVTLAGFLAERWFKSQEAKMKEPESFFKNRNVMFPPLNPTESRLIAPSSHNSNDGFIDDECSYSVQ